MLYSIDKQAVQLFGSGVQWRIADLWRASAEGHSPL
jgi:hypothetical protein